MTFDLLVFNTYISSDSICFASSASVIPVSRRISRRPLAEKKIWLSRRFSAGLFYRRSPQADKFNVSPIEKTEYCRKNDSRGDSNNIKVSDGILLSKLEPKSFKKAFCGQSFNPSK